MNNISSKVLGTVVSRGQKSFGKIFGGLPGQFFIIWSGTFINRAGTFVAPFLTLYLTREENIRETVAAVILMSYSVGVVISGLVGGFLADFIGRKRTMVFGLAGAAVVQVALVLSNGIAMVAICCVFLGLLSDVYRPAASAMVADLVGDRAPQAFGLLHWATNLGVPIASIAAGYFATRSWGLLFAIDALTALVFAVLVFWKIQEPERVGNKKDDSPSAGVVDASLMFKLLGITGISFAVFAIYFQNTTTLPLRVIDAGHSESDFGFLLAINGVLIAIVQPLLGPILSSWEQRRALSVGLMLTGFGIALSGAGEPLWFLVITVVLWSFGEIILAALLPAVIAELAPAHARGRYLGFFGTSIGLGGVVAPLGIVIYRAEPNALWVGCALIPMCLVIGQYLLLREKKTRNTHENFEAHVD